MDDLELLRALRDADAAPPDPAVRDAARRALRDHSTGLPVRSRHSRRRWLAATGVAAAAAAALAVVTGLGGGEVAPSAAAARAVERAAHAALETPGVPDVREGQFLYIRERDAYMGTAADLDPSPFSVIAPEIRETWVGPDGSGRIRTRRVGPMIFPGPRDRRRWEAAGRPEMASPEGHTATMRLSASGFGAGNEMLSHSELAALPTDGRAMYERLIELAGDAGSSPDAEAFTIIGDLLRSAPVPAAQRAGLYRAAAHIKGVRYAGAVRDSLGRRGLALEMTNDAGLNRLIFDPATSEILAEETVLTELVDYIDAPVGAPAGGRVVVETAVVDRVGERPGG